MKKISIIIPMFNAEAYVEKCVESLINQTIKDDIEIIIINDGSTDNSLEIVKKFNGNGVIIKTISNKGPSGARNIGISIAVGEYIMFVDSDDWVDNIICEALLNAIESSNADFVVCDYCNESSIGTKVNRLFDDEPKIFKGDEFKKVFINGIIGLQGNQLIDPTKGDRLVSVWAKLYKRSIIIDNDISFIDLKLVPSECQIFNLEYFFYSHAAVYIKKPLYHYRKNSAVSLTKIYRMGLLEKWEKHISICKYILGEDLIDLEINEAFYNSICFSVIQLGGNAIRNKPLSAVLNEFYDFLNHSEYIKAFSLLDFTYMPVHWKIFFYLAKSKNVFGFYLITRAMRFVMDRRRK